MDREATSPKPSPQRVSQPIAHSSSSPFITPRRSGSSASIKTDIMSAEASKASPRKEGIKRSLTMSASAATFAPLLDQMNQKFSRSITDLPVASDIPRMAPRTSVIDVQTDSLIFNRNEGTVGLPKPINAIDLSKSLLVLLFAVFSPDNKRMATIAGEKFDEVLPVDFEGDTKDRLNGFLDVVVGNDTPVSAILKCINQGLVAPAIMALRIGLMGKLNYKDCGNNWDVEVRVNIASAVVIHQKREQLIPAGCEFVWRLEIHFVAPYAHISHVDFHISEVHFTDDTMDMERKIKIVESLSSFLSPALRERYASMSPSKIGVRAPLSREGSQSQDAAASSSSPPASNDSLPLSPRKLHGSS